MQGGKKIERLSHASAGEPAFVLGQEVIVCRHVMMCLKIIISVIGQLCSSFCFLKAWNKT